MGRLARLALLALALGAPGAACSRRSAPALAALASLRAAPREPACPPIPLEESLARPRAARAPAAPVSLAVFLRPLQRGAGGPRAPKPPARRSPRVELGTIVHVEAAEPRRRDIFDLSRLDLPRDLVREELPSALRERWDVLILDRDALRRLRIQHVHASRRLSQCRAEGCALERCIERLDGELSGRIRWNEDVFRIAEGRFIEELQAFVASERGGALPGATLALGYATEEQARVASETGTDLEAAIALYERVKQAARPASDIDWWARYLRGYALADMGNVDGARREFTALAALPAAPRLSAEANFRRGELDPSQAIASYQAAAKSSGSDPAARMLHWGATYRWANAALARRDFRAALAAAADLAWSVERTAETEGEVEGFFDMATPILAEALNALGAVEIEAPPTVPATLLGELGAAVADGAVARFDVEAAVRAWRAVLTYAPDAPTAPRAITGLIAAYERADQPDAAAPLRRQRERDYGPISAWSALVRRGQAPVEGRLDDTQPSAIDLAMPPPLPRIPVSDLDRERDLTGRVQALLFDCDAARVPVDPGEIDLRVDLGTGAAARITAQTPKGAESPELIGCLSTLGPAYFVDAPADLRVTVRFEQEGSP